MLRPCFFSGIAIASLGAIFWQVRQENKPDFVNFREDPQLIPSIQNKKKAFNVPEKPRVSRRESSLTLSKTPIKKVEEWTGQINQWIVGFPFPQEEVQPIPEANPPDVAKAVTDFIEKIDHNILMNTKLSREEKIRILWDVYRGNKWPEGNNALRGFICGGLAGLYPYELSEEIATTYQNLLPQGGRSRYARHDLLEMAGSILNIGKEQIGNNSLAESIYEANVPPIKEMLRQQILHTTDVPFFDLSDEIGDLMGLSMQFYAAHATQAELESLIPEIQAAIDNRPEFGTQIYSEVFRSLFANPDRSLTSVNSLLTSPDAETQDEMNSALAFLLKEDGNVNLSALSPEMRTSLVDYFQSQNHVVQGGDYQADWHDAFEKLR